MRLLTLIILTFLVIPVAVSAHMGFERELFFTCIGFIVIVVSSITIFLIYLLRRKSHLLLLFVDIILSIVYAVMINRSYTFNLLEDLPGGPTLALVVLVTFFIILGTILFIKKKRGRDVSSLSKTYVHGIVTGILAILFVFCFARGAVWILYVTNCDVNLILNYYDKGTEEYRCIVDTAVSRTDSELCNKFGSNYGAIRYCKAQVSIKAVELGDLSGCDYLKSSEIDVLYKETMSKDEKEVVDKCRK